MLSKKGHFGFLSSNVLKLLACVFMVIDHVGFRFFPYDVEWRIVGRLAFPIFAFMIAEGAKYTRNKLRYFLTIAILAAGMEGVYYLFFHTLAHSIFATFAFSVIIIFTLDFLKRMIFIKERNGYFIALAAILFVGSVVLTYFINEKFRFDYNFGGVLLPVLASLFRMPDTAPEFLKKLDNHLVHLTVFGAGLLAHALTSNDIQIYALLTLPLILLYSGTRGKVKLKYFFYVFYPAHLVILEGLYILFRYIL